MHLISSIVFIFFKDKPSYENCFACSFHLSCIESCLWPFLSLNFFFFKRKHYVNDILWDSICYLSKKNLLLIILKYAYVNYFINLRNLKIYIYIYIYILHWSMTKRIFLHKLHRHAFMSMRFSRSIIYTWERQKRVCKWVRILAFIYT